MGILALVLYLFLLSSPSSGTLFCFYRNVAYGFQVAFTRPTEADDWSIDGFQCDLEGGKYQDFSSATGLVLYVMDRPLTPSASLTCTEFLTRVWLRTSELVRTTDQVFVNVCQALTGIPRSGPLFQIETTTTVAPSTSVPSTLPTSTSSTPPPVLNETSTPLPSSDISLSSQESVSVISSLP